MAFVNQIKAQGVDDVKIGIAAYNNYNTTDPDHLRPKDFSSPLWSNDLAEIQQAVNNLSVTGGQVDPKMYPRKWTHKERRTLRY